MQIMFVNKNGMMKNIKRKKKDKPEKKYPLEF